MTKNQRQQLIDDYQKRIHLLRKSLGKGHLEGVERQPTLESTTNLNERTQMETGM